MLAAGSSQIFSKRRSSPAEPLAPQGPKVYVLLWFDTEDYILPQSDDAAKRLAVFLTQQNVRATFKVVGEKARVLNLRQRRDVIGALAQHEIGYHSNTHSQHPTVAEYESTLDWQRGVDEFSRRERPGFETVRRVFGQTPTCYGQPGSSWAPQSFAALKDWGVNVYLDDAKQVGLNGEPFWYGGLLNFFNLRDGNQLRPNADWSNLADAKADFQDLHLRLTSKRNGGVVSLYFHPCEFVHKEFWDGVNFARGANPDRADWKVPPMKSPEESEKAFTYLQELVTYIKAFPRVEFVTASQGLQLFRDTAQRRAYSSDTLGPLAAGVSQEVSFQELGDGTVSPSEIFFLLNNLAVQMIQKNPGEPILLDGTPYGPATASAPPLGEPLQVSWAEFSRAVLDVADFLRKYKQLPGEVWFGSRAVPPESYLLALARVTARLLDKSEPPLSVTLERAHLATAQYVADDAPALWDWVIFPPGFRAPQMMQLAKLQAWTLKPARLAAS
jgi:Polysaccharide deacetylase